MGEIIEFRRIVASAEQWQRRWVKRAFPRLHPPGVTSERVGWLKRLEHALRERGKRFADTILRFRIPV